MNGELILFVILLLSLILCSFLGVRECMENATVYYGPNGATAVVEVDSNGQNTLVVTSDDGSVTTYTTNGTDTDVYVAPSGATATIKQTSNNITSVTIRDTNGNVVLVLTNNPNTNTSTATTQNGRAVNNNNYDNYNHYNGSSTPTIFYGPDGGTAKVIETPNNNTIVITNKNGSTEIYYIDTNNTEDIDASVYYGPNGGSAKVITDENGNRAVEITTPSGTRLVYTGDNTYADPGYDNTINQYYADASTYTPAERVDNNTYRPSERVDNNTYRPAERVDNNTYGPAERNDYYNSLPPGIPRSQIPPGDEDLYILKSQIVPPVCPICPSPIIQDIDNFNATKCPPCPPCARCPEPAFDCVKRPNYNAFNPDYMPVPVISDFSGFGM